MRVATRCVASALAIALAGQPAWGHSFPPVRTIVVQVESCELVVMIGYRPGSGEPVEGLIARASNSPKSRALDSLRDVMSAYAVAPLTIAIDGHALVPTTVRAKLGVDDGTNRPMIVVLETFALPASGALAVTSRDPRTTRISWQDRDSHRVDLAAAPAQDRWHAGVASFLLTLAAPKGVAACVRSTSQQLSR